MILHFHRCNYWLAVQFAASISLPVPSPSVCHLIDQKGTIIKGKSGGKHKVVSIDFPKIWKLPYLSRSLDEITKYIYNEKENKGKEKWKKKGL